jgi:hypothetical protein
MAEKSDCKAFNQMRYGWSKFGGGFFGLVKNEGIWICQACGEEQTDDLPQYYIAMDKSEREFVRICSICKHVQLKYKLGRYNYTRIIQIVRKDLIYG